ncbi:MAG: decaprenyl-phosphate phosphoribosyltransferase [Acidobacteria bacterium]|jgi:4-hydroxybenzoate polyprenyltransferase|nr:decaprenyl-phosphate phosphoribosyltransferase [Thermoanaerobaculia bacterium]NLN11180.1 decaprenyl-phosphate phosphoribosyltransferase [Acidobacteriota bacterium]MBP7813541.1 decaprenyl-phosphate phosphoribosyltransferase [Thermoanaerobaculia bacterium]MBP8844501.1 decaprenyl-phosphate phosphoribosyltransferase [Thermoanaerobaculia bacterium]HPA95877.1 decaprenyl-phosphate phosphoribosyltransferase [Thermoanaerobaculia bacterium]
MLLALLRSLRPAQWTKNLFVLVPLLFAGRLSDPAAVGAALLAFASFSAAASAVYLFNDLRDRERDRAHPLKRHRPLASGRLSPAVAAVAALLLAAAAAAVAVRLGVAFGLALGAYLAINLLYTLALKRLVILDVMAIAAGFLLRVLGGAAAIPVAVSPWLLLCTGFLSLFLGFSKRRHELLLSPDATGGREVLAHYSPAFLDQMINVVTASTVVCYALYAVDAQTVAKFGSERLILTLPMVLFGIFRYLYLAYQVSDPRSPTDAILTDLPFLANLLLWAATAAAIVYAAP